MSSEADQRGTGAEHDRWRTLARLESWLEMPMVVLAFVWLAVLVLEFVQGETRWLIYLGSAIWVLFIIDFVLRLLIAPSKIAYLKSNWLTAFSLVVPALRVFRIFAAIRLLRVARVARSLRLIRVLSSVNRGMRALSLTMRRRGFPYVALLTLLVTFVGAAGMLAFEKELSHEQRGLHSYGQALWWTAMIITTMGTDYWPLTTEGRVLCFFLALYAFAVFGYVTATIATFFIGRDAQTAPATDQASIDALKQEIAALRAELQSKELPL